MNAFEGIRLNPRLASLCVRTDTPDGTWYGSNRIQEREDIIAFNSMIGPSMMAESLADRGFNREMQSDQSLLCCQADLYGT